MHNFIMRSTAKLTFYCYMPIKIDEYATTHHILREILKLAVYAHPILFSPFQKD